MVALFIMTGIINNKKMDKQVMVCFYNAILLGNQKE